MAKKKSAKRAAPSMPCPKCGKGNHPRKLVCEHCGAELKKAAPKKKTAAKKAAPKAAPATDLKSALKAERANLQQKMDAIDKLLDLG